MSGDNTLYVQGVPEGVSPDAFEKAVNGAAKDVTRVNLNPRKRFAHVVFSSHEAADKGLKALKKASIGGQTLDFEWSKAKDSSNNAEFDEANNSTIYIRGLATTTAEDDVKTAFADYGEIERAFLVNDKKTKSSKGQAIIEFKTRASAEKALELNETELDGQTITVEFAKSGPRTNSKGGKSSSNGSAAKKPAQKRKASSDEEEEKPAKKAKASETPKTAAKKETPKKETAAAASTKKETPKKETAAAASTKKETPKKETAAASPAKKETPKKTATPSKAKGKK